MQNRPRSIDRLSFLRHGGALVAAALLRPSAAFAEAAAPIGLQHPDPRPGITAQRVLSGDALGASPSQRVGDAYDAARQYPEIFDGLACGCGCTGAHGEHRSLLVCYETKQPTGCWACQDEAKFVANLANQNKTLPEIREAVDKKFG